MKRSTLWAIAVGTLLGGAAMAQDTGSTEPSTGADQGEGHGPLSTETNIEEYSAIPGPSGFEIGFRVGYAIPLGDASGGTPSTPLSDLVSGMVPLQLDVGYRINGRWMAGAYAQYGFAFAKDRACGGDPSVSCSAHDIRVGAEGQYHLMPVSVIDPWVGLGIGYEWLTVTASAGGISASATTRGMEFFNVSAGADYKLDPKLGVGPFIGLSVGQYSSSGGFDIPDKSLHMWLSFGMRGVFDILM